MDQTHLPVCDLGSNHSTNPTYYSDQNWVFSEAKAWVCWDWKSKKQAEATEMDWEIGKKGEKELD